MATQTQTSGISGRTKSALGDDAKFSKIKTTNDEVFQKLVVVEQYTYYSKNE